MEQPGWAATVGATIAAEVRRHRQAQGISAQQLADACTELGGTMPRVVISNIENGRRSNISVAEVTLLAAALKVPPIALLYPIGYVDEVELLPGRMVSPIEAADWWDGANAGEDTALQLMRRHRWLVTRIRRLYKTNWEQAISDYRWGGAPGGPEADAAREVADGLTTELHELRDEITRRGLTLPPLEGLDRPV